MEQDGETQKQKKTRVSWRNESLVKTFLEACIREVVENGREGASLKPQSWRKVGEVLKDTYNMLVDQKQMKHHYDYLRGKYSAWCKLKCKTGNVYDPSTNRFNLSDEEWIQEIKANKMVEALKTSHLSPKQSDISMMEVFFSYVPKLGNALNSDESDQGSPKNQNDFNILHHLQENYGLDRNHESNSKIQEATSSTQKKTVSSLRKRKKKKLLFSRTGHVNTIVGGDTRIGIYRLPKVSQSELLRLNPKLFNVEVELLQRTHRLKVVPSYMRDHVNRRPGGRSASHLWRTLIVYPLEEWAKWDGSFSMELLETNNEYCSFSYVFTPKYERAQIIFDEHQAAGDDEGYFYAVLSVCPYHLDTLLYLAETFRLAKKPKMSMDFTAKAVYALERASHHLFIPDRLSCRLICSGDRKNMRFFRTVFEYMKKVDARGCPRTALEVCKLLLFLDPNDPVGILLCIDYFALRAEQYQWLEMFTERYIMDHDLLWFFPNFRYSLGLCKFYVDPGKAKYFMEQALLLHPCILMKLVTKLSLQGKRGEKGMFDEIIKHEFFRSNDESDYLDFLYNVYIEMSFRIWRRSELLIFLRDTALEIIKELEDNNGDDDAHVDDAVELGHIRREAFSIAKIEYLNLSPEDFTIYYD